MTVHWTDTALAHLQAIYSYIAQDSPNFAKRMVDRLTRRSQQIARFPFSGRRVPEYDIDPIREVIEGSYRLFT
jgi:plasmid stabilization system protein ParE